MLELVGFFQVSGGAPVSGMSIPVGASAPAPKPAAAPSQAVSQAPGSRPAISDDDDDWQEF